MRITGSILICILCLVNNYVWAQTNEVLNALSSLGSKEVTAHRHIDKVLESDSEIEMFVGGLFVVYKTFISSQDGDNCSFEPSCSEYAVEAIQRKGIIEGPLMFFDRYTRCNALSPENYKYIPEINRLYDPVE